MYRISLEAYTETGNIDDFRGGFTVWMLEMTRRRIPKIRKLKPLEVK